MNTRTRWYLIPKLVNCGVLLFGAVWLGIGPAILIGWGITDPALKEGGVPRFAKWCHGRLSPRMEAWARARVASGDAATLSTSDLIETEWPMFGTTFYLWATEAIHGPAEERGAPLDEDTHAAVDAALELILDPAHAKWVHDHWGPEYMTTENAFYRMMLVGGLAAHANLTGDTPHHEKLRELADSLMADIDASDYGLLYDYPGECYPGDVLAGIAAVQRADAVLGTDHSEAIAFAVRGFEEPVAAACGLPPFSAELHTPPVIGQVRGSANSYICTFGPELWPGKAQEWFDLYDQHFWQERMGIDGFREHPRESHIPDSYVGDMDAGPVLLGFGMAASAFGVGASRAMGRFDRAYPLSAEMIAASWPLPDGTLLLPRFLSNLAHAPHLGEACILFNLSRPSVVSSAQRAESGLPPFVYLLLVLYAGTAALLTAVSLRELRRALRSDKAIPFPRFQGVLWGALVATGLLLLTVGQPQAGLIILLAAQFLPRPFAHLSYVRRRLKGGQVREGTF